jgi:hypothetical protein
MRLTVPEANLRILMGLSLSADATTDKFETTPNRADNREKNRGKCKCRPVRRFSSGMSGA